MEPIRPSFDELKEKGNSFIKEKRYQDALECYTSALELRPTEHTIFSNRSLAYLRVGRLEDAFSDACRCVEICPEFARGYMRKAVALNMLQRYEEAQKVSVAGYLLRGSNSISKECVSQWLTATRMLFDDFYKGGGLPTGTVILSAAYFFTLFNILESRRSSASGMSAEKMERCLLDIVARLREVLATFGHSASDSIEEWVKALCHGSLETDPRTSILPKGTLESAIRKSEALAEWVNSDIDSILYPLVRPLLILAVMAVLSHTYVLNCMNLGHEKIQVLSQVCLVLFEQSVLNTEEYLGHHVGTIVGLLDSFIGRGTALTPEDVRIMEHYCTETEKLLPRYEATRAWEKEQVKDIAIRVVANVRSTLKMMSTGMFIHSESLPQESLMSGEVAKRDALKRPAEVREYMEKLIKEVKAKAPTELLLRDAVNLVHGSVGLMKLQNSQKALEAFSLGEQAHFSVFALQAHASLWSLEDAPAMISTSRNEVMLNALALRVLDPSLLPGVLVRWKCLFTEFRTLLMRFGLKGSFAKAFMSIDSLRRSGQLVKADGAKSLASIMQEYQQDQKILLEKWGPHLMLLLSQQSPSTIQKVLEPGEAVLEIAVVGNVPADVDRPGNVEMTGILLLILPQGKPVVEVVNFSTLIAMSTEWPKMLNEVIVCPPSDTTKRAKHQQEADKLGKRIREILFPTAIETVINSGQVDCLYLCPDMTLGNLPLDLLPWADGKYLFEKCSVSYLSSCREALREWCIHLLRQKVGSDKTEEDAAAERNPFTNSVSTECLVFADPDYDLEIDVPEEEGGGMLSSHFWEVFKESLGLSPHSTSEQKRKVERLPKSFEEAKSVKHLLSLPENGVLKSRIISGKNATLLQAVQVESPLVLHFSTHGFSQPSGGSMYGGNFWTDMTTGLALAGCNTYRFEKTKKISPAAGTGELTAMAACGMDLEHTRLVYLSTCVSSIGFITAGESVGSLAQAFRAAGAETVVATLWPVVDEAARKFAVHFYEALCKRGTKPSRAIVEAKQQLCQEAGFEHWYYWGPFVCIGYNLPLLLPNAL